MCGGLLSAVASLLHVLSLSLGVMETCEAFIKEPPAERHPARRTELPSPEELTPGFSKRAHWVNNEMA